MTKLAGDAGAYIEAVLENSKTGLTLISFGAGWCEGNARIFLNDSEYANLEKVLLARKERDFASELGNLEVSVRAGGTGKIRVSIHLIPRMDEDDTIRFSFIAVV